MKKITLAIQLAIFSLLANAQTFTVGDINYQVTSTSPPTVEVQDSPNATGDVVIPATVDNNSTTYTITSIGSFAFTENQLTSVTIPAGVTNIGGDAFSRNQLTTVTIPDGITTIKTHVFSANNLTSVTIPAGVTTIESSAFANNILTSITIPAGVTTIESRTFDGNQLTSISMPGVTNLEEGAFANNALTSFAIPSGVISIGDRVFESNQLTSITIPASITSIGDSPFDNNSLTSVTVENPTPLAINANVFTGVTLANLTLNVPASGKTAYQAADVWKTFGTIVTPLEVGDEFTVNTLNYKVSTISPAAVEIQDSPSATGALVIPATVDNNGTTYGVTSIGIVAFRDNQLTSVIIPVGVTSIKGNAFEENQLTSVTIPAGVTSIGSNAFDNNKLTSVTIPTGVTSIGSYAFNANELISVNIPEGITRIEDNTFTKNKLTSVSIPASVTEIGRSAFKENQLASISLPVGLTSIGSSAFSDNKLTSISIPSGITNIGNNTFRDNQLTSITLPASITSIDNSAFANNQLTSITLPATVTSIGENAFAGNQLTSVTAENPTPIDINSNVFNGSNLSMATLNVPAGVKEAYMAKIVWTSFGTTSSPPGVSDVFNAGSYVYRISSITPATVAIEAGPGTVDVVIPEEIEHRGDMYSITSIDDFAFNDENDLALESVVIPASVVSIGKSAFGTDFTSITVKNSTPITISADVFEGLDFSKATLNVPAGTVAAYQAADVWKDFGTVTAPPGVAGLFTVGKINYSITSLSPATVEVKDSPSATEDVVIPATVDHDGTTYNVTSIGDNAFDNNDLRSIVIPAGVITIGNSAFSNNSLASRLRIPDGVTSIGNSAFESSGAEYIRIPASVSSIGNKAFKTDFRSITVEHTTPLAIDASVFTTDFTPTLNVPVNSLSAYKAAAVWKDFEAIRFTVNSVNYEIIPTSPATATLRESYHTVGDLVIPSTVENEGTTYPVTKITDHAFLLNEALTSVIIPEGVTSIGYMSFASNLISTVTIPSSVTQIGGQAFSGNQLTSVTIPSGVTTIERGAFEVNKLTSITLPSSVTIIEEQAFANNQLASFDIPSSVTSIGQEAFANNQLTSVTIPASVTTLEASAFSRNLLTSVIIPDGITSIKERTFEDNKLTSITIPSSVTSIGVYAFGNNKLTSFTIPASITSIGESVFADNQLTSITIPAGVTSIGTGSFSRNQLTSITIPASVTSIGEYAFSSNQLTNVTVGNTTPLTINTNVFDGSDLTKATLNVPTGTKTDFQAADIWKDFGTITDNVTAGDLNYSITSNSPNEVEVVDSPGATGDVTIPATVDINGSTYTVTSIGRYAFEDNSLTSVSIPSGVTKIGEGAFESNQLTSITIPASVTSIEDRIFHTNLLTSVTIPEGVTSIGDRAFVRNKLKSIVIPSNVTEIKNSAFRDNSLENVTISASVISIEDYAFSSNPISIVKMENTTPVAINPGTFIVIDLGEKVSTNAVNVEKSTPLSKNANSEAGKITTLEDVTLIVPTDAKAAYQAADVWKTFGLITETNVNEVVKSAKENTLTEAELTSAGITQSELSTDQLAIITVKITSTSPVPTITAELQAIVDTAIAEEAAVNVVIASASANTLTEAELTAAGVTQTDLTNDQIAIITSQVVSADPTPNTTADLQVIVDAAFAEEAAVNDVVASASANTLTEAELTAAGVTQTDLTADQLAIITSQVVSADPAPNSTVDLQTIVDEALTADDSVAIVVASANANTLTEAELTAAGVTQTDLTADQLVIITSQVVSADPTPNTTADLQVIVDAAIAEEAAVNDVVASATANTLTEAELTAAGVTQTDLTADQLAIITSQVFSADPVPNSTEDLQTIVDAAIAEEAAVNVVVASAIAGTLTQEELTTAGITQTDLNTDQITRISANIISANPAPNATEDLQTLIDEALTTDDSVAIVVASAKDNTLSEEELTAAGVLQTDFTADQIVVITLHIISADPEPVIKSELQEIVDAAIAEEAAVNIVVEASIIDALTASELTAAGITQTNLTADHLAVISLRVFLSEPAPNTTAELQVIVEAAIAEEAAVNVVVAEAVEGALSQEALTAAGVTQKDLTEQQLEAITTEIISFEPAPNTTLELQDLVDFVLSIILSTSDQSIQENQKLVYPNPTSGILNINLINEQFSIEVYDVNGLLISTTPDISHAVNGVYFIKVISEKGTQTRRIIKK